jgi:uncharacterized protein YoxC
MIAGVTLGGIAALVFAAFWAVLVFFMALALVKLWGVLEETKTTIERLTDETVPLLSEVTVTVTSVNTNLEQVAGATKAAANVARSADRVSKVVEQTVSSPLIKLAAAGYGFTRASKKVRKT